MIPREHIAQALFDRTAVLSADLSPPGLFVTRSRQIVPAVQVNAAQMPALYQMQDVESIMAGTRTMEGLYATKFRFIWVVYAAASQSGDPPSSTALNNAVDAALSVLPPGDIPFEIDGVQCNLFWDGSVNYIEGIIQDTSMAEIPVIVEVPWAQQ